MTRRRWVMLAVGILMMWVLPVAVFAGEISPATGKATASNQVRQQGKQPTEDDVQSRGLFSKKKKTGGGAAARSQPSDRIDSTSGNPAYRVMP